MVAVSGRVAGNIAARFGVRPVIRVGGVALGAITLVMALGTHLQSLTIILISLIVTGAIFGLLQPSYVATVADAVPDNTIGVATSLQTTTSSIGQVVGIGLCTAVAANSTRVGPYVNAYVLSAGLMFVAALLSLLLKDVALGRNRVVETAKAVVLDEDVADVEDAVVSDQLAKPVST